MPQNLPNGVVIPNGVNPAAWSSGDIQFLSGTPGSPPSFTDLTSQEQNLFDADFKRIAYMTSLERDLAQILLSQRDGLLYAASIAKNQLPKTAFGGLLGAGGFNMQLIRATTILANVTVADGGGGAAFVGSWARTFTKTGWQALFGSNASSDPVSLGVTGSSNSTVTTYQRVVVAAPFLLSTGTTPRFAEIKAFVKTVSYPVYPVTWLKLSDIYLARLPGILLALVNDSFAVEANITTTGDDEPQLLGLQFVTNDYAVLET
jgi:hypothetical protein